MFSLLVVPKRGSIPIRGVEVGLALEDVLDIIMDSNESELDANGEPIYDANGKFLKGPNYWKVESRIEAMVGSRVVRKF